LIGVRADLRVNLAVAALEVGAGDDRRPAVAWSADEDGVQVASADDPIKVRVDQIEARGGAPVAEQPGLHVLDPERLAQ
jgi:hypothetical protein